MIGEVQRDAAVALAERLDADPDDFAGRRDRVEIRRIVAVDPRRQDLGLEDRRGQRRALQLLDGVEQRIERRAAASPRPARSSRTAPSTGCSTGSTSCRSFASERRRSMRSTPASVHSRPVPPGRNSPSSSRPAAVSRFSTRFGGRPARARSARRSRAAVNGAVRPRVAQRQVAERVADRLEQRLGEARPAAARRARRGSAPRPRPAMNRASPRDA